ncbi:hypothetical protein GCM10009775_15860 [Microbacterium aoyamense]|uniref:Uncharacterized protein n=1 Tax=Microbacterium aoyamense TaxID=344166 RepID=A0ABN2PKN2_9MICO|nr:hypothetical protein [Microbacterium aoyamense]
MDKEAVLAWVESPLQLVGAAEWAAAEDRRVPVAGRLTPQMSATADELLSRGARFGALEPYVGIPWSLLSQHGHWLVGDGFSGQFRLAASVLRPRRITFLDDGANAIAFAETLLGTRPYARPGVSERGLTTTLRPFALEKVLRLGRRRRADFFTAFDLGPGRRDDLADRGFGVRPHAFEWTRASAPAPVELGTRIALGSARPVDGRMPLPLYLQWVAATAAAGPVAYLPHRRETDRQLDAVAAVAGVRIVHSDLPVELVLAGTRAPLEIFTLPSSTTSTLPLVLAGTGSVVRTGETQTRVSS